MTPPPASDPSTGRDRGSPSPPPRPSFGSRFGVLATMIGVAVGLGNIWRFPYMTGKFGGATFVAVYALAVAFLGVPALAAEWSLGRLTRRGPVGAFREAGLPFGQALGWLFFFGVTCATAYYTNAVGWVLFHGVGQVAQLVGAPFDPSRILPPESGFDRTSFGLQLLCSTVVVLSCATVLRIGFRRGTERLSKLLMPLLLISLAILIARGLTLPGAGNGIDWYLFETDFAALRPDTVLAAIGQAFFSLSLGGTFMVVYGSYLSAEESLLPNAGLTAFGDLGAGLLAGFAILPAVIALGLEPTSGPGLLFATLPRVFAELPNGGLFGALFYLSLFGAAFLSSIAAFEVLIAGLVDELRWTRQRAIRTMAGLVLLAALPPMINLRVFVPWDLTFGSGFQTLGALVAVVAFGWFLGRRRALDQLAVGGGWRERLLWLWLRFVVPAVILGLGLWWLLTDVLGLASAAS